jgi:aromatic-L-amino-acid/L-tryptophan decarboxylase
MASEMITSGYAMLSPTVMRGKTVQRMCTINPRTTRDDIETTIAKLHEIGVGMSTG